MNIEEVEDIIKDRCLDAIEKVLEVKEVNGLETRMKVTTLAERMSMNVERLNYIRKDGNGQTTRKLLISDVLAVHYATGTPLKVFFEGFL